MTRWILSNPKTGFAWEMPINPDQMTSPEPQRSLSFAYGVRRLGGLDYTRTLLGKPQPVQWTWQGAIHDQSHHDSLVNFAEIKTPIDVSDHLGRKYRVLVTKFAFTDRPPTPRALWRGRYEMTVLILRRIL